jgi:hypothetical protein
VKRTKPAQARFNPLSTVQIHLLRELLAISLTLVERLLQGYEKSLA